MNTTGACRPGTCRPYRPAPRAAAASSSRWTQEHYLGVVRGDHQHVRPRSAGGCRARRSCRPSSAVIAATIASASSRLSVELPSWSSASTCTPGSNRRAGGPRWSAPPSAAARHSSVARRPRTAPGASDRSGPESSRVRRAACAVRPPASPARTRRPAPDACPDSPAAAAGGRRAAAGWWPPVPRQWCLPGKNWPASSITNRSRLPAALGWRSRNPMRYRRSRRPRSRR